MEVNQYIKPHLEKGGGEILNIPIVHGAFKSAWWPAILKRLREAKCPETLVPSSIPAEGK